MQPNLALSPRRHRGLTLTELMIATVVSSIVMIPFGIFFVQMTRASTETSEKLMLTSTAVVASIAVQNELIQGSTGNVLDLNGNIALLGTSIEFSTSLFIGSKIHVVDGNLVLDEGESILSGLLGQRRVLAYNVSSFTATRVGADNNLFDVEIRVESGTASEMAVTVTTRVLMLNASVQ